MSLRYPWLRHIELATSMPRKRDVFGRFRALDPNDVSNAAGNSLVGDQLLSELEHHAAKVVTGYPGAWLNDHYIGVSQRLPGHGLAPEEVGHEPKRTSLSRCEGLTAWACEELNQRERALIARYRRPARVRLAWSANLDLRREA